MAKRPAQTVFPAAMWSSAVAALVRLAFMRLAMDRWATVPSAKKVREAMDDAESRTFMGVVFGALLKEEGENDWRMGGTQTKRMEKTKPSIVHTKTDPKGMMYAGLCASLSCICLSCIGLSCICFEGGMGRCS